LKFKKVASLIQGVRYKMHDVIVLKCVGKNCSMFIHICSFIRQINVSRLKIIFTFPRTQFQYWRLLYSSVYKHVFDISPKEALLGYYIVIMKVQRE